MEVLARTDRCPWIHYTTVYKVFAKWADDESLWQAFIASVAHLAAEKHLDTSVLHGDGTNTVAKKGAMELDMRGTSIRSSTLPSMRCGCGSNGPLRGRTNASGCCSVLNASSSGCVFHGILPFIPQQSCHLIHSKVATPPGAKAPFLIGAQRRGIFSKYPAVILVVKSCSPRTSSAAVAMVGHGMTLNNAGLSDTGTKGTGA